MNSHKNFLASYEVNGCPYQVVSEGSGWILRLREEYKQYGAILEAKTRPCATRCRST